jgi:hypothetical protein
VSRRATPVTTIDLHDPADHPLPAPVFVTPGTVGEKSGNLFVAPYKVNVGVRWAGQVCDAVRDGDHIVIYSATTLVRELTAGRSHPQLPARRQNTRTYRTREPKSPSWK